MAIETKQKKIHVINDLYGKLLNKKIQHGIVMKHYISIVLREFLRTPRQANIQNQINQVATYNQEEKKKTILSYAISVDDLTRLKELADYYFTVPNNVINAILIYTLDKEEQKTGK